jgi:beta-glucosidase/6-phospho-beta-glucosidase/beta-galactosidase
MRIAPSALLVLAGCSGAPASAPTVDASVPPDLAEVLTFPSTFRFGTATAGWQVEMGCPTVDKAECQFGSDWTDYVTAPSLIANKGLYIAGDPPSYGPGFYELYGTDIANAAGQLHNDSLRLSIEWGRVFPNATDGITGYDALKKVANPKALAFYHAVFAALKAKGMKPYVTVIHYVLPSWIHDAVVCHDDLDHCKNRGWLDHDRILAEVAKYADFLGREFGGEVDDWASLNEPLTAVILAGYLFQTPARTQPPAVTLRVAEAKAAMVAEIEGHARIYDALKAADTVDADGDGKAARVGIVYNLQSAAPSDPTDPTDVKGAKNLDYLMNKVFLNAIIKGDLDANLDGNTVHRADLEKRVDVLGVNYYARVTVSGTDTSTLPMVSPLLTFQILAAQYDYGYARGIYEVIDGAKGYGVPMVISETGFEDPNDKGDSAAWVARTLVWVKRAMLAGAPVEGYYYWSLMDNYEWNHGMAVRMGLYAVDPKDPMKTRKPRSAVALYGRIAGERNIAADVLTKYPTPNL